MSQRYQTTAEELDEALGFIRTINSRDSDEDGYVLIIADPTRKLKAAKGCSLNRAKSVVKALKKRGDVKYVRHGGDKLASGRRGHAWLIRQPDAMGSIQQQFELGSEEGRPPEVVEFEGAFNAVITAYASIRELALAGGRFRKERDEARTERDEVQDELNALKAKLVSLGNDELDDSDEE